MKKTTLSALSLGALLTLLAAPACAGDAAKGADAFAEECGDCHSSLAGKNKKGPSINGVLGRTAGTLGGYAGYSEAMKSAGFAWTADKIEAYIAAPRKLVPGGKMKYDGLPDASARGNIIAYLQSLK